MKILDVSFLPKTIPLDFFLVNLTLGHRSDSNIATLKVGGMEQTALEETTIFGKCRAVWKRPVNLTHALGWSQLVK